MKTRKDNITSLSSNGIYPLRSSVSVFVVRCHFESVCGVRSQIAHYLALLHTGIIKLVVSEGALLRKGLMRQRTGLTDMQFVPASIAAYRTI